MTARYWGDERHPDALYAVFLRKVRYVPPTGYEGGPRYRPLDPDRPQLPGSEMGADHLQWESVRERVIKAGTPEKLIECIIGPDDVMDSRHFNVFFATYRAFTSPPEVLRRLMERFKSLEADTAGSTSALVIQNSIRSVLICWMDMYPEDFYDRDDATARGQIVDSQFPMLTKLLEFGQQYKLTDMRAKARKLLERFKHMAREGGRLNSLPSLEHYANAFGYDSAGYLLNSGERRKMFDVGKENCVQIAEQLTFWDAALFRELLTHQCQGCIWGQRHKVSNDRVYTVKATIDQFNMVSQRVMTSIVIPDCCPKFRAKIIAKWIDIARELRAFKNFSSLKAVLSSLQSEPIHRLKSAWQHVSTTSMAEFHALSAIFTTDESGDEPNAKRILDEEGTAKSSPLRRPQLIQTCRRTKSDVNLAECQGTVPYLGSFLTDLQMIDQAYSDKTEDGLINFEKRRKEFEVLAKLRLFQSAARAYKIRMDPEFCAWFYYLPSMNENDCYARSKEIEKGIQNSAVDVQKTPNGVPKVPTLNRFVNTFLGDDSSANNTFTGQHSSDSGFQNDDWTDSTSVGPSSSQRPSRANLVYHHTAPSTPQSTISWKGGQSAFYDSRIGSEFSPGEMFPRGPGSGRSSGRTTDESPTVDFPNGTRSLSRSNTPLLQRFADSFHPQTAMVENGKKKNGHHPSNSEVSNCSNSSTSSGSSSVGPAGLPPAPASFHLARVGLDDALQTEASGANYKCIKVENGDRMPNLIDRVLEKHLITDGDRSEYCLVQLLPNGGEFQLPDKCNPYYAMAPDTTSPMLNLILRRKKDVEAALASPHLGPSAKKLNKMRRSNLLRWSSGYL